ncbi:ester cyclase [Planctomonas psychrotolerans]|uniref:ester cyclase n=1 Tax=Planctomonas psychrotolerans TaxID=2528712 RepID=UPI00123A529E|nr:ester cyclase [Planctomonas psychrotolerans]
MTREQNVKAQERLGELLTNRDIEHLDEVFDTNVVDHDPAPGQAAGVEGIKQFWTEFLTAFPDAALSPETLVADDDNVVVALTITGTHDGPLMGIEPTGKSISVRGIQIGRFENGKLVERWGATDQLGILQQIGAVQV